MNIDLDKLQEAKMFMDYLANGVDPVNNIDANAETLHNENVISCFRYISIILENVIQQTETEMRNNSNFYITDEQINELRTFSYNCKVSELAVEINRVAAENGTKKLSASWINDWLESEGYLCKSDLNSRIATEKGHQLGITSEHRKRNDGTEYYINFHTEQAQQFIFSHLNEIIAFRNNNKHHVSVSPNVQYVDYPNNISIWDFIKQQEDKCFIMSIGSCDTFAKIGSYISLLLYKGKSKILKKSNIPTNSANKCILFGIQDAAMVIKAPTDVIIISSTSLGFSTPKSTNYALCQDVYRILEEKDCNIYISVCQGKGNELNNFIKSFDT